MTEIYRKPPQCGTIVAVSRLPNMRRRKCTCSACLAANEDTLAYNGVVFEINNLDITQTTDVYMQALFTQALFFLGRIRRTKCTKKGE